MVTDTWMRDVGPPAYSRRGLRARAECGSDSTPVHRRPLVSNAGKTVVRARSRLRRHVEVKQVGRRQVLASRDAARRCLER